MTDRVAVWHRADLRTADNPALRRAADATDAVPVPVFVLDPALLGGESRACDARVEFLLECLAGLRERYRAAGSDLTLRYGDPRQVLPALPVDRILAAPGVTAGYGRRRDRALVADGPVEVVGHDGIRRPGDRAPDGAVAVDTREGWDRQCEAYMTADPHDRPRELPATTLDSDVTLDGVRERHAVAPTKTGVPTGGRSAAEDRLQAFVDSLADYPGAVAPPAAAEEGTSGLSAYLALGVLSVREVHHAAMAEPPSRGREMFVERLYWNRHYTQKLADDPRAVERATNPVTRGLYRDEHDPELVAAWQAGRTGFPLVDAGMRALTGTGWLNFRTRALVATFFTYVLREWWRRGADFMYRHLIDADPAINYTQWQSQSGLVGVHPVRVYDPAKQVREYDPDGTYVRRYVPELEGVPDEYIDRPERMSRAVQAECGVELGEDYPRPVVDYERRADRARSDFASFAARAREALSDPQVRYRASLSAERQERLWGEDEPVGDEQASLEDF